MRRDKRQEFGILERIRCLRHRLSVNQNHCHCTLCIQWIFPYTIYNLHYELNFFRTYLVLCFYCQRGIIQGKEIEERKGIEEPQTETENLIEFEVHVKSPFRKEFRGKKRQKSILTFSFIIIIFSSGNMTVTSGILFTRTSQYLFFTIPTVMESTILLILFLNV